MDASTKDLGAAGQDMAPAMALALSASFGSVERWREEFVALGKALDYGSGWVLLNFQPHEGRLVNQRTTDPALAGGTPILAMDMNEHAHFREPDAQDSAYVDDFVASIAWDKVYDCYQQAVLANSTELAADPQRLGDALLLDVRRAGLFKQAKAMLPGASWRDPALVSNWASDLPRDREIVVYCVYGHEVGRSTALRLRAAGLKARFLPGGIDAWTQAGRPLQPKMMDAP